MHATANIDGIDLHIAEVYDGLADRGCRLVEEERLPQKTAGGLRGDADGGRHGGKCMNSAGRGQARACKKNRAKGGAVGRGEDGGRPGSDSGSGRPMARP